MDFEKTSKEYEDSLSNEYKKSNGVFYTDVQLAQKIIKFLNIPNDSTIIDANCGTGAFIKVLIDEGYKNIYGCDIDGHAVNQCKTSLDNKNTFCMDTIGNNGESILKEIGCGKFDYVVGNPPYVPISKNIVFNADNNFKNIVKYSGNNLFVAALYRFFEIAKDDGIVSIIIPKNLLHVSCYRKIREILLKKKRILSVIELGIHFKTVRGEQIVLTFQNSYREYNEIKFYSYNKGNLEFMSNIPQDYYDDEIIVFTDNKEMELHNKLKHSYQTLGNLYKGKIGRGKEKGTDAIRGKQIMKFKLKEHNFAENGNQIFIQNIFSAEAGITACFGRDLKAGETITVIETENETMCRYLLGILSSRVCNYYLIKFIFNNSRLTMHTDAKYLNKIPVVVDKDKIDLITGIVMMLEKAEYLSKEWYDLNETLNDAVYKIYKIHEYKEYIEKEMKKVISKKWYMKS